MTTSREITELGIRKRKALKELLSHELIPLAIKDIKEDLAFGMMSTLPSQADIRERLYYEFIAFERLEGKLAAYIGDLVFEENKEKST